jgi:hypothetical protein
MIPHALSGALRPSISLFVAMVLPAIGPKREAIGPSRIPGRPTSAFSSAGDGAVDVAAIATAMDDELAATGQADQDETLQRPSAERKLSQVTKTVHRCGACDPAARQ